MANKILVAYGKEDEILVSFKAGTTIPFNSPVKLSAAGTIVIGTGADSIGWATDDAAIEAKNDDAQYLTGQMVRIKTKNEILNLEAGAAITLGDFVKGTAAGKYIQDTGGAKATATVGTVVFTAVSYGSLENNITVETTVGVAAGSEVVTVTGTYPSLAIVVQGNAASTIGQVQTAIAANATAASVITADSLTTFAADTAANLAGGTDLKTVSTEGIAITSASADGSIFQMMRF